MSMMETSTVALLGGIFNSGAGIGFAKYSDDEEDIVIIVRSNCNA